MSYTVMYFSILCCLYTILKLINNLATLHINFTRLHCQILLHQASCQLGVTINIVD